MRRLLVIVLLGVGTAAWVTSPPPLSSPDRPSRIRVGDMALGAPVRWLSGRRRLGNARGGVSVYAAGQVVVGALDGRVVCVAGPSLDGAWTGSFTPWVSTCTTPEGGKIQLVDQWDDPEGWLVSVGCHLAGDGKVRAYSIQGVTGVRRPVQFHCPGPCAGRFPPGLPPPREQRGSSPG